MMLKQEFSFENLDDFMFIDSRNRLFSASKNKIINNR